MAHPVIPIVDEHAAEHVCASRQPLVRRQIALHGDVQGAQALLAVLVDAAGAIPELLPADAAPEAWVRSLELRDGEATLTLAAELGCRGHALAELTFDVMRIRLHDTDVYVRVEPSACG